MEDLNEGHERSAHPRPLDAAVRGENAGKFRRDELQDLLDAKAHAGLSYSVIAHLRWDLRQVLRMAVEEEILPRNPAELLFVPRSAPRPVHSAMTFGQVDTCLRALNIPVLS